VGTIDGGAQRALRLRGYGVDEIACLIDFGIGFNHVMAGLRRLSQLLADRPAMALGRTI
jgi:hypothetical protein